MNGVSRDSGRSVVVCACLGALLAVVTIPSARSTVGAELALALGRRPEWMSAAAGGSWARLRQVAAAHPHEVALQVGLATLPPIETAAADAEGDAVPRLNDPAVTIQRLEALNRRFPGDASIRAHLLRHLTRSDIQIDRLELAAPEVARRRHQPRRKPLPDALRVFAAAASEGMRLEPNNGYFDVMRAVGEFAADQDEAALRDLHAAAEKPDWDDHATEEPRAQWKLLIEAYGDRGAAEMNPGVDHLLLPHFAPLRQAARVAVWHAEQRERASMSEAGAAAARSIRRDVMQLGMRMALTSPLIIGKSVGLALFDIGIPRPPVPANAPLNWPARGVFLQADRERRYENALRAQGDMAGADWFRAEVERSRSQRSRLDRVRAEWEDLGPFPPERWTGWWTFGILLLEEIVALMALWVGARLLGRGATEDEAARPSGIGWAAVTMALLVTGYVVAAIAQTFGLTWHSLDVVMALRLFAGFAVLWVALNFMGRAGPRGAGTRGRGDPLVWVAATLALCLVPTVLWTVTGSTTVLQGSFITGLGALGMLALAGRTGHGRDGTRVRARWKPVLVAFVSILPFTALAFIGRDVLALSDSFLTRLMAEHSSAVMGSADAQSDPGRILPAVLLLPPLLLLVFQLCRVVALNQPFRVGMTRGLRLTVPAAIVMLLAVYLVALVPTIARDRAAERRLERMVVDELSGITGLR